MQNRMMVMKAVSCGAYYRLFRQTSCVTGSSTALLILLLSHSIRGGHFNH